MSDLHEDPQYWRSRLDFALLKMREFERIAGRHRDADGEAWDKLLANADTALRNLWRLEAASVGK